MVVRLIDVNIGADWEKLGGGGGGGGGDLIHASIEAGRT